MENENQEYLNLLKRFESATETDESWLKSEEAIRDAITIFCIESTAADGNTPLEKAGRLIARHLMALPADRTGWKVTFPYVWIEKDNLSEGEKIRRSIAFDVFKRVKNGTKVTHAIAQVAAERIKSPQKITKDYYDWLPEIKKRSAELNESKSSTFQCEKKE